MQIIAFQVLRDSLVDMASFVEGTEPVIGMKYDNGQANRLRRLAVYLSSYQDQLQGTFNKSLLLAGLTPSKIQRKRRTEF